MANDEKIQVLDPYTNTMVEPDPENPAHQIAVAAMEAALSNAKSTSLDGDGIDGPVLTSGIELALPSLGGAGGAVNADEKQALGIKNENPGEAESTTEPKKKEK